MTDVKHLDSNKLAADANEAMSAGMALWRSLAHLPLTFTAEAMRFTSRRIQAQADHLAALDGCDPIDDVMKLQSGFFSQVASDYQAEAAIMSRDVQNAVTSQAHAK